PVLPYTTIYRSPPRERWRHLARRGAPLRPCIPARFRPEPVHDQAEAAMAASALRPVAHAVLTGAAMLRRPAQCQRVMRDGEAARLAIGRDRADLRRRAVHAALKCLCVGRSGNASETEHYRAGAAGPQARTRAGR